MKKILFILLSTISIYGQTTTGKETKFINGIRNQASQVISDPTNLVTQGTDGTQGVVTASTYKDVLKYATASAFPLTGVVGKLYYDIATDLYYKWDGATYEEFGAGGTETDPLALKIASNLGDLASASTARTNLGLGTLATQNGTFSDKEDVSNKENTTLDTSTTKYPTNNLVKASIDARVSQYNTYFVNTATGNNATGVYEDATKPFASIDYVLGLGTYAGGTIFLQNAGTFVLNTAIPSAYPIKFQSDVASEIVLSANTNTYLFATSSGNDIEFDMPLGKLTNNRSGGIGVSNYTGGGRKHVYRLNEIYVNQSNTFISGMAFLDFRVKKVSCGAGAFFGGAMPLFYVNIDEFVCLVSGTRLYPDTSTINPTFNISLISGSGSFRFDGGRYNIGNITTTGTSYTSAYTYYLNFVNSNITSAGGINVGFDGNGNNTLVITGNINTQSAFGLKNSPNTNLIKFLNFSTDIGTRTFSMNVANIIFENCSIKSTNTPITLTGGATSASVVEIKNSTFEVVNAVPLITGGAGGTNTVKIAGLSTNATMLSDQSGTGVTVNYIGKQSVATAVNPNDAVTKAQLDAAVISGGGGADLSTTYAPTTVTIVSSSGTDATVNAVDGVNAGIVTTTQKTTWDGKQDALGFTPYNASNPSGYQTASQVTTAISSRISNDPYNIGWMGDNNAANKAVLYDKFELTDLIIADKQPLSAVLTATTASFTTADETKLDGIATGANVGVVPNASITGATKTKITYDSKGLVTSGADASLNDLGDVVITSPAVNDVIKWDGTNWINGVASPKTTGDYTGTIVITGTTAPTGATNHSYVFEETSGFVEFKLNIDFATSGTGVTSIACELPSGAPTPSLPTGVASAGDVITYGTGTLTANRSLVGGMGICGLRLKSTSPNVFEVVVTRTSGTYQKAYYSISYAK